MEQVESILQDEIRLDDLQIDPALLHLAQAGGKRLRPLLVLLASELGQEPENNAVYDAAVAVELTHLASLYHDDVMDDAPMRRGVLSAQEKYSNSVAILAGDVLFARASAVMARMGAKAVTWHAETFARLCTGQLHETLGRQSDETARDYYIGVLADKTGSLIAAAARYGVYASGGSDELGEQLAQWAERVGVAFQLADDVLDIRSDGVDSGKTPGTDLREGVDTMPIIFLREAEVAGTLDEDGKRILHLLATSDLSSDDNLNDVVSMLRNHSCLEATSNLARSWVEEAENYLVGIPDGEVKEALIEFGRATINRVV
ncbi:MAG: polyprenyl synthetase family protein [Actinomycetaceae bacterium]|nr:polyprenyl synthetase family protein [Actinomycetaceae bacterium]